MSDLALFAASLVYFWVVMFDRHPRFSAFLAGLIVVGTAGVILKPEAEDFYRSLTTFSVAGLLVGRAAHVWRKDRELQSADT